MPPRGSGVTSRGGRALRGTERRHGTRDQRVRGVADRSPGGAARASAVGHPQAGAGSPVPRSRVPACPPGGALSGGTPSGTSVSIPHNGAVPMSQFVLAKLLTLKVGAAVLAVTAGGGVAFAAATGTLPVPLTDRTAKPSAHASGTPSATDGKGKGPADAKGSPSPNLVGLCRAYRAGAGDNAGKALESAAFRALVTTAGDERLAAYCDTLLAAEKAGRRDRPPPPPTRRAGRTAGRRSPGPSGPAATSPRPGRPTDLRRRAGHFTPHPPGVGTAARPDDLPPGLPCEVATPRSIRRGEAAAGSSGRRLAQLHLPGGGLVGAPAQPLQRRPGRAQHRDVPVLRAARSSAPGSRRASHSPCAPARPGPGRRAGAGPAPSPGRGRSPTGCT